MTPEFRSSNALVPRFHGSDPYHENPNIQSTVPDLQGSGVGTQSSRMFFQGARFQGCRFPGLQEGPRVPGSHTTPRPRDWNPTFTVGNISAMLQDFTNHFWWEGDPSARSTNKLGLRLRLSSVHYQECLIFQETDRLQVTFEMNNL